MSDTQAQAALPQQDGSLADAVAAMPDFDDSNLIPFEQARDGVIPQRRDQLGRYAGADPQEQAAPVKPAVDPRAAAEMAAADAAAKKAAEDAAAAAQVSQPEEEFFELPPEEEGGEPRRIPATEVFEGYQKAQQLEAEMAEMKRTAPPVEYDRQIYETVQVRGRLMNELQTYAQLLQPQQPDPELIRTDPDAYYNQVRIAQQMGQQLQAVRRQMDQLQAEQTREQEALSQARFARERGKLHDVWPEVLSNPQKAAQVRDAAARLYGIDNQTFATTIDARFYAILKDALAYRDGIKAQQTAVKVVRAKPKLVRSTARSGETAKQMATNSALQRVARTHSLDDAAEAIGGLLG